MQKKAVIRKIIPNSFIDEYGKKKEDALNEDSLIKEFNDILETTQFHVYGLSGDWGTGKSAFIQMWKNQVDKEKYSSVIIDAFENDYIQNPFNMIFSAFELFMKENKISKDIKEKVKEIGKKIVIGGLNLLKIITLPNPIINQIAAATSDTIQSSLMYENQNEDESYKNLVSELKKLLTEIIKSTNKQLYIIIDELDRCRPDFAIETLEKIKHLFPIDNVKFILVYNPDVIKNIVKVRYGIDDHNNRYIKKFIEKDIPFNPKEYYRNWLIIEANELNKHKRYENVCTYINNHTDQISTIMIEYNLSLRDTQRILASVENCNDFHFTNKRYFGFDFTIAFFKSIFPKDYNEKKDYCKKHKSLKKFSSTNNEHYFHIFDILTELENTEDEIDNLFVQNISLLP